MSTRRRFLRAFWLWAAPFVGLLALVAAFYVYWRAPRERSFSLRFSAGAAKGTRHELAQILRRHASDHGLRLHIEATPGSEAALDAVNSGALDAALVQGGLRVEDRPEVRQVATLHVEPLHLLVKKELAAAVSTSLRALEGKTVNLGEIGSGTHSLSIDVLEFAGVPAQSANHPAGYIASTWNQEKLIGEKQRARLPDAVFLVSSVPSEMAKTLVSQHEYRLAPLAFAEAFALDALAGSETDRDKLPPPRRVNKGRVVATTIPAFTYQVEPPVPATPLSVLGTRLLLVAHRNIDTQAVRRLVDTVYATEFASAVRPPLDAKLLDAPPEFPWHAGTRDYLDRNTPIVSGVLMDATQKGFAIFAAAASGLFVLWQWLKLRGQHLRDHGFRHYIGAVTRIEENAACIERDQMGGVQHLLELRDELGRLKTEALDRFSSGELVGHELLPAFLIQANDVRDHLLRLIDRCGETRPAEDAVRLAELRREAGTTGNPHRSAR